MNSFEFYSPTKVVFGKGVENQVAEEIHMKQTKETGMRSKRCRIKIIRNFSEWKKSLKFR